MKQLTQKQITTIREKDRNRKREKVIEKKMQLEDYIEIENDLDFTKYKVF